jgi:hypothetical protein
MKKLKLSVGILLFFHTLKIKTEIISKIKNALPHHDSLKRNPQKVSENNLSTY